MDRGALWVTVNGVAESDTTEQLSPQHSMCVCVCVCVCVYKHVLCNIWDIFILN